MPRSSSAAYHTLRYLSRDSSFGFFLFPDSFSTPCLLRFWLASCSDPVSGFFHSLGGSPISSKYKKQPVVALSSVEAEYRSMYLLISEVTWEVRLLHNFSLSPSLLISLHCDNQTAILIAKDPVFYEWTKHIWLDSHFIGEKLLDGLISLYFVPSSS